MRNEIAREQCEIKAVRFRAGQDRNSLQRCQGESVWRVAIFDD